MSKIRFDLKKIQVPSSIRLAARVLQAIDTQIHTNIARFVSTELFARGMEQGFSLYFNDREEGISKRVAFAQEYRGERIVVYYASVATIGEFMRQLTAFKDDKQSLVEAEVFAPDEIHTAAQSICDFFDEI